MKILLSFAAGMCLLMSFAAAKTINNDDAVIAALKSANASAIANFLDDNADIKLPGKEEIKNMDQMQAGAAIKNFFTEQNISGFDLVSQRQMDGTGYVAGKFKGSRSSFNVTVMTKTKGNQSVIISIRIN